MAVRQASAGRGGSRSCVPICVSSVSLWNTSCGIAPGRPSRWNGSSGGAVKMAGSLASATCSPDTRRPTGSARGAGGSPHARVLTASSNSRRLTSWTGWPISCRRRGSTGSARRFETSQGCSPRITSSGPPSRPSPNHPPTTPRDAKGQTHGPGGRGVSCCVPGVWWRHPTHRRRPAGAGLLRTGGSQAGEGQDGFARVKSAPDTSR